MSQLQYLRCDGCKVAFTKNAAEVAHMMVIALGPESGDVCSVECAMLWVAEQLENKQMSFRLTSYGDPYGTHNA